MEKKVFYLFRHGQTDYNLNNIWVGCRIDCPLNDNGIAQAHNLAEKLHPHGLQAVFTSPLKRAYTTAQIVSHKLGIPLEVKDLLRESDYGSAEGMPTDEVKKVYPQVTEAWINPEPTLFETSFPEGESLRQTIERMQLVLDELVQLPYNCVGLASHAGTICTTISWLGVNRPRLPNCGVVRVVYRSGSYHFDGIMP